MYVGGLEGSLEHCDSMVLGGDICEASWAAARGSVEARCCQQEVSVLFLHPGLVVRCIFWRWCFGRGCSIGCIGGSPSLVIEEVRHDVAVTFDFAEWKCDLKLLLS